MDNELLFFLSLMFNTLSRRGSFFLLKTNIFYTPYVIVKNPIIGELNKFFSFLSSIFCFIFLIWLCFEIDFLYFLKTLGVVFFFSFCLVFLEYLFQKIFPIFFSILKGFLMVFSGIFGIFSILLMTFVFL